MSHFKNYGLTEIEKEYLYNGETASYSEAELQDRIQEKQDSTGTRLQHLIRDLSLMYQSEFYNFEDNDYNILNDLDLSWLTEFLDIALLRGNPAKSPHDPDWGRLVTKLETAEEFGYLIGGLLRILLETIPDGQSWKKIFRGLFHFYLMGSGEKLSANIEDRSELCRRYNILKESVIFEQVEKMNDEEHNHIIYTNDTYPYKTEIEYIPYYFRMDIVREVLQEKDIPSEGFLELYLTQHYDGYPSNSAKNMILEKLSDLLENQTFTNTIELYKFALSDKRYLENEWRGPDRISIFKELFDNASRIKSSTIATNLGESSSAHLVTRALSMMSDEADESKKWTSYSATRKHENGWQITPYGFVLGLCITGEEKALERYAVPSRDCLTEDIEKLISEALNQINNN